MIRFVFFFSVCTGLCCHARGAEKRLEDTLESLRVVPGDVVLSGADSSQRFLVLGTFGDGMERDLTALSSFSVSDSRLAAVESSGRVNALADGELVLQAKVWNATAKARLQIQGSDHKRPSGFARDIGGILTRQGCNGTDCHGGVKGKDGFKLSINALRPRDDYGWIVEGGVYQVTSTESGGPRVPRINLDNPAESLVLQKATQSVEHGGGERFEVGSPDYLAILDWIHKGAPYGNEDARIADIEIFPSPGVLEEGSTHGLLVTARLTDGRREDISDEVKFDSGNQEVLEVDEAGRVRGVAPGETAVLVRAAGHSASASFGVISEALTHFPRTASYNFIDDHVFAKLRRFNIRPSDLASDAEFLRRVCLDLTGSLPPPERVREFLASRDPGKRHQVVDALLDSQEYVEYWTFRFADLFRVANGMPEHAHVYWQWIQDSITENKPLDAIAREKIAAQGFDGASRHYVQGNETPHAADAMAEQVRVFMGRRLDCAQCHDHPYENWTQDQFWGLAAFFKRVTHSESPGFAAAIIYEDPEGPDPKFGLPADARRVIHPRTGHEMEPTLLDGRRVSGGRTDFRATLADWMTAHPFFAQAMVNRIWGRLFHRGIVDPVDDFRSSNPPSHPDLLEALARDFREHGHDLKHLLRRITESRTYQLASIPNASNENDMVNYSHQVPRALDAEILLDAISTVTGVPEVFENTEGGRAPPGTRAIQLRLIGMYPSEFLKMYGQVDRQTVPERNVEPSLAQALHMLVGATYTEKLHASCSVGARPTPKYSRNSILLRWSASPRRRSASNCWNLLPSDRRASRLSGMCSGPS